tara:strand:+ start:1825 stop:2676 length:852 start_codon:yes stop_codon:yes gene_type:complete
MSEAEVVVTEPAYKYSYETIVRVLRDKQCRYGLYENMEDILSSFEIIKNFDIDHEDSKANQQGWNHYGQELICLIHDLYRKNFKKDGDVKDGDGEDSDGEDSDALDLKYLRLYNVSLLTKLITITCNVCFVVLNLNIRNSKLNGSADGADAADGADVADVAAKVPKGNIVSQFDHVLKTVPNRLCAYLTHQDIARISNSSPAKDEICKLMLECKKKKEGEEEVLKCYNDLWISCEDEDIKEAIDIKKLNRIFTTEGYDRFLRDLEDFNKHRGTALENSYLYIS